MQESYYDFRSKNSGYFRAYEIDFNNPGEFLEDSTDAEITLEAHAYPGYYDGSKWINAVEGSEDLYLFLITYRCKNRVDVRLISENGSTQKNRLISTYSFIKEAAKRFYLVNDVIPDASIKCDDSEINSKWSLGSLNPPSFEDVEELLVYLEDSSYLKGDGIIDINSWHKSMTVEEAKELFNFLGVEIKFPE